MIRLLPYSWLFSLPSPDGLSQPRSVLSQMLRFLKKRYRGLKMKFRTLKLFQRRRNARKKIESTNKAIQALIIGLMLGLILLVVCNYNMGPHETKIEYGTTETDSKNDKLQQKQSISQSWKWEKR